MNKEKIDKYIKYFLAASNYYGVIELDELVDAYFEEKDYDELYELYFICFEKKLIKAYKINEYYYLTCYDLKGLKECLRQQTGKKLKIVNKKELLKYAGIEYYQENNLTTYLRRHGVEEKTIVDVVNNMSSIYFNFNDAFCFLVELLGDNVNLEELAKLLKDTNNNMPMHSNRGYSPNELSKLE